ncbi:4Fe-4S dicluster domain-containing protein [Oceanidesulfovibrio marinus]|uniref:4Fe-4S ferredoxin-type domain-containing protein n=1 Tax=Oceanidesulfovibrio marinus TaxID=370038 RepID=A0A6P1ZCF7_9BACT|nr:4Fe-4S dicluster domain-containing protein [Oceanidesulfovibrio marinus]TVM31866.1 hypothetical protein DQK91_16785 [Oceanidesulfovibrio marinus]
MDFLTGGLLISLAACLAGFAWRIRRSRGGVRISSEAHEPPHRAPCPKKAGERGGAGLGVLRYLKAFLLDVLFQAHLVRASVSRWTMHFLLAAGFVGLLLMHAMDGVFSRAVLPMYEPTLDPYQWLRNLFGLMVLAGVALAVYRRLTITGLKRTTRRDDWFALAIIAAIVLSGFVLESAKITSQSEFDSMVADYFVSDDPAEIAGLQMVWANEYGVVFTHPAPEPMDMTPDELLALGREVNDFACTSCHSDTASAFVSYPLSRALKPAAPVLGSAGGVSTLWYVHVLLCFLGIVYLPFGKMAHVFLTPLNLLVQPTRPRPERGAQPDACGGAPGTATTLRRTIGMEACMHCGMCSEHCSVAASYAVLGTAEILPSEKLRGLRHKGAGELDPAEAFAFAEGSFVCTECHRCTDVCPARIDLQELWISSKRTLMAEEAGGAGVRGEPHRQMTRFTAGQWAERFSQGLLHEPSQEEAERPVVLADRPQTFWACVQCTTCTNVCPVVAAATDPVQELDLTPQQIMNMLRMGLRDHVLGARMVWSCVTCYKCQEHCPQGVRVADVLFELRNIASARLRHAALHNDADRDTRHQGGAA